MQLDIYVNQFLKVSNLLGYCFCENEYQTRKKDMQQHKSLSQSIDWDKHIDIVITFVLKSTQTSLVKTVTS